MAIYWCLYRPAVGRPLCSSPLIGASAPYMSFRRTDKLGAHARPALPPLRKDVRNILHINQVPWTMRNFICWLYKVEHLGGFRSHLIALTVVVGLQKPWWSPDLETLKQQCIDITDVRKNIGKPRSGEINSERLKCKYRYKQASYPRGT